MPFWFELRQKRKLKHNGQVNIPISFRRKLGLETGDSLTVILDLAKDQLILKREEEKSVKEVLEALLEEEASLC